MKKNIYILLLVLSLLVFGCSNNATVHNTATEVAKSVLETNTTNEDNIVTVSGGQVKGNINNGIYEFLGIPYAEAKEYFKEAKKVSWDGIFDATKYGDISIQSAMFGGAGGDPGDGESNNCQNLNIWTSGLDNKNRAVMVWLHGGGFSSGSANDKLYNGANLAKNRDVVLVGVNHRLGTFGHLNLSEYGGEYKYSGNIGVDDIVKALEWIHDNISAFGGDPNNVTIFGESGGGAKVITMMTTGKAKGLFNKGIIESGATETMGVSFSSLEPSLAVGRKTLEKLKITSDNIEDIQNVSAGDIQRAASEASQEVAEEYKIPVSIGTGYSYDWEPVVDGDFLPTNPVLDDGFAKNAEGVNLLIGSNLNEWSITMEDLLAFKNMTDEEKKEYQIAYPNEDPNTAMFVDTLIRKPILKIMSHKYVQGRGDVYAYVFTKQLGSRGSFHTAEIPYVFDNIDGNFIETIDFGPNTTPYTFTEADKKLGNLMAEAWTNFAKTGVPSANGLEAWEKYDKENMATMILDDESYLAKNHDRKLMSLLEPDYKYWP